MTMLSGSVSSAVGDGWVGMNIEASDWTVTVSSRQYWSQFVTTTAGNVRYVHFWLVDGNGITTCLSLHSSDGTKLLSASAALSDDTEGWYVMDAGETYELAAATTYLLAINRNGGDIVVGRSTTCTAPGCVVEYIYKDYDSYSCGQAIGEGTAPTGDTEAPDKTVTIVWDNTSSAAPSTP